ncbi:TetR/AcrR family transcriptional regulator [Antrihabitans sp. YC3-6]|uniref:TetR/AcrR family transcriptional regulator n=1 Tax=Antrihabitans stalagmiti TaxID=2799499 RepID=A0A934NPS4_9NOCA|nr:TetR/AcrR family transcriptional regulator [Antrihabitans stalagmiti]MBJ8339087.1 TetR/AcrR family transcriptional regulator [Antrihabitans stalagmiti]
MVKRRRPLTREESQALTREIVLEAAEELFLEQGFHATSVAQIGANAGRTPGSIYGNFPSKEALCFAVLERHYKQVIGELADSMGAAGEDVDSKLDTFGRWWKTFSSNQRFTMLSAEYIAAVRRDAQRFDELTAFWTVAKMMLRSILAAVGEVSADDKGANALLDSALVGITSSALGLMVSEAGTMVDSETSATVLTDTMRLWMNRIQESGKPRK